MKTLIAADLLCGAGGTTTGLIRAAEELGYQVELHGVNHDPLAIETIRRNHPNGKYFCEDLEVVKPEVVVPGRHLHILAASPECVYFSRARGALPKNDQSRAIAGSIVDWVQRLTVDCILVENVPEFVEWGPLYPDCNCGLGLDTPPERHPKHCHWLKPIPEKRGKNFIAWINALKAADYTVQWKILTCADYGDPTTRQRFFLLARRGRKKIQWPEPTHARNPEQRLFGAVKPWRTAREIIDWSIPGASIFNRKRPLSPNTIRRIVAGLRKYSGIEFVIANAGTPNCEPSPVDDPLPPANTGATALVQPFLIGQEPKAPCGQSGAAPRVVDEPLPTIAGKGAISFVEPYLVKLYGTNNAAPLDAPLPTVTANGNHLALAQPFILNIRGGNDGYTRSASVDDPAQAVTTSPALALVEPFLVKFYGQSDAGSVDDPLPTVTAQNNHLALAQPFLVVYHGTGPDGRERTRNIDDPMPTVPGSPIYGLAEPFIVGQRSSNAPRSVDDPLMTVTTTSRGIGLVQPFIVQMDCGGSTQSVDDPIKTITSADARAVVEPFIVATNHGPAERATSLDEPMKTVTSVDAWAFVEPFLISYYQNGQARSVDEPLDTITTRDRFALVVVLKDGRRALMDIRFRMLQPHELARAQGFPDGYHFAGTRERKVKLIGNAVPVSTATALCRALLS